MWHYVKERRQKRSKKHPQKQARKMSENSCWHQHQSKTHLSLQTKLVAQEQTKKTQFHFHKQSEKQTNQQTNNRQANKPTDKQASKWQDSPSIVLHPTPLCQHKCDWCGRRCAARSGDRPPRSDPPSAACWPTLGTPTVSAESACTHTHTHVITIYTFTVIFGL